jgi:hypothetical protein
MMKISFVEIERAARRRPRWLLGCRGLSLVGLRLSDDDLRAVEREEVELQVEALAVAMRPGGTDFAPVTALAVLGHGIDPVARAVGVLAHGDVLSF